MDLGPITKIATMVGDVKQRDILQEQLNLIVAQLNQKENENKILQTKCQQLEKDSILLKKLLDTTFMWDEKYCCLILAQSSSHALFCPNCWQEKQKKIMICQDDTAELKCPVCSWKINNPDYDPTVIYST